MKTRTAKELGLLYTVSALDAAYSYTEVPTGDLDLLRALDGKSACWKLPLQEDKYYKKKIIITNWASRFDVSNKDNYTQRDIWQNLINEGYEVYAWTGKLTQINNSSELEDALKKVVPIHPDDLRQAITESQLTFDECFIADYAETLKFMPEDDIHTIKYHDQPEEMPVINLNKLVKLSSEQIHRILSSLKDKPVHRFIINDIRDSNLSKLDNEHIQSILKKHQIAIQDSAAHSSEIRKLLERYNLFTDLYLDFKKFNLAQESNETINFPNLATIKISLLDNSKDYLGSYIRSAPQLTSLDVSIRRQTDSDLQFPKLQGLRDLKVDAPRVDCENLSILLKESDQLENLEITGAILHGTLQYSAANNGLKSVSLKSVTSNRENIATLIKHSPGLNSLRICNLREMASANINSMESIEPSHIMSLDNQYSDLIKSNFGPFNETSDNYDDQFTEDFIINKLKSINMINAYQLHHSTEPAIDQQQLNSNYGYLFNDIPVMASMASIELQNSRLTNSSIAALIDHSPNLRNLSLKNENMSSSDFKLNNQCAALEHLSMMQCELSNNSFINLLSHTPNLKSLNLTSFYTYDDIKDIDDKLMNQVALKHLEEINIHKYHNEPELLSMLLNQCDHLRKLSLTQCELSRGLTLSRPLTNVEELDLTHSNISTYNLIKLLKSCPNLKVLKLQGCANLLEGIPVNLLPKQLEHLDLSFNSIPSDHLQHILSSLPNLKSLNLNACSTINRKVLNSINLEHLDSLSIENTSLSDDNVYEIQAKFPKLRTLHVSETISGECIEYLRKRGLVITIKKSIIKNLDSEPEQSPPQIPITQAITEQRIDGQILTKASKTAQKVFHEHHPVDLHPARYRCTIFNKCSFDESGNFILSTEQDYKDYAIEPQDRDELHNIYHDMKHTRLDLQMGELVVSAEDATRKYINLPGLTAEDHLNQISITPAKPFFVEYCELTGLYRVYITEPCDQPVSITYLMESDPRKMMAQSGNPVMEGALVRNLSIDSNDTLFNAHPPTLDELIAFCSNFQSAPLDGTYNNDWELLNLLCKEQKGSCRHRSMVFMALAEKYGIKARAVSNQLHMYIEVFEPAKQKWRRIDLGGTPTNTNILDIPGNNPEQQEKADELVMVSDEYDVVPVVEDFKKEPKVITSVNRFTTWDTMKSNANNVSEYCMDLLSAATRLAPEHCNVLINSTTDTFETLHYYLSKNANDSGKKCFAISHLDDISESSCFIVNDHGTCQRKDSELFDFIKNAKPGDVLLVNWSDYQSRHVNSNSMIDSSARLLRGLKIPDGVIVMGVLPNDETMGEDFYSRFSLVSRMPSRFTPEQITPQPVTNLGEVPYGEMIQFYDNDWQSAIFGNLCVQSNGKYHYSESEFIKALKRGDKSFIFQNAPWHLSEFRSFITKLCTQRQIEVNGEKISIPADIKLTNLQMPISLDIGSNSVNAPTVHFPEGCYNVNIYNINHLFVQYSCTPDGKLNEHPGFIESYANKRLPLAVTHQLSRAQWAKILTKARQHNVHLDIYPAQGISLPDEIKAYEKQTVSNRNYYPPTSRVVITNDGDYFVDQINNPNAQVICISENTTYSDLMELITLGEKDGVRTFNHQTGYLAECLLNGTEIILKGRMSPQLAAQLESLFGPNPYFMQNGKVHEISPLQLTLVTDQKPDMSVISPHWESISDEIRWSALIKRYGHRAQKLKSFIEIYRDKTHEPPFSYAALVTMLNELVVHPHKNPIKPFIRLHKNHVQLMKAAQGWREFVPKIPKPDEEPMDKRLRKVLSGFQTSPYVFVAGSSGVGKSSFFQNELDKHGWKVHEGLEQLAEIIYTARQSGQKTAIFVDEANLFSPETFAMLENLFSNDPFLLINGKRVNIPDNIKFVFAGNFTNFKGRQQHDLFKRHGSVITFKELPDKYLTQNVVKPALERLKINGDIREAEKMIMKIYHHVNNLYPDKHPLTARNLHMIAMRTAVLSQNIEPLRQAVCMAAFDEISGILNKSQRAKFKHWLEKEFEISSIKENKQLLKADSAKSSLLSANSTFKTTKSRINPIRLFDHAFRVRELKNADPELRAKGTAGLLIEGEPGIGKSLMAVAYLESQGFMKHDSEQAEHVDSQKTYYHLTATTPEAIKTQLLQAFHEGAVVIIDELNTLALEPILNRLLSGVDFNGRPADKPGFFIIGTQNPTSYAKREKLSDAFMNRLQRINLKDYTRDELIEITAKPDLVDEYLIAREYALSNRLQPAPTPRDLFRNAPK